MAKNNIYLTMNHDVHRRYAKVPVNIVAGLRPDPVDPRIQVGWTLNTAESDYDLATKRRINFVYENEVIEIYSEAEDRVFRKLNQALLNAGLLREYVGTAETEVSANFLTDDQVLEIVNIRSIADFKRELQAITSPVTLQRVKERAEDSNVTVSKLKALDARMQELTS